MLDGRKFLSSNITIKSTMNWIIPYEYAYIATSYDKIKLVENLVHVV